MSAELVTPYPPGVPVVAPGDRHTEEAGECLGALVDAGGFVVGAVDASLETLRVVAAAA